MRQVLVDTNVVVSFLTDRDPQQQAQAEALFAGAADGEHELVLHQIVLTEIVHVLRRVYLVEAEVVSSALRKLLELPGIVTIDALGWPAVLDLWPRQVPEFIDAALAAIAAAGRFDAVATFDQPFRKRLRRQRIALYW